MNNARIVGHIQVFGFICSVAPLDIAQRTKTATTINDRININCQIEALKVSAFTAVSCMEKPNAASNANNMAFLVLFDGKFLAAIANLPFKPKKL
tara:strand:- start:161 stop:445 length:285 start_codon:yes stop_codon:yes gene_type:complete